MKSKLFLFSFFLLVIGIAFGYIENTSNQYVDENNVLIESWFMPLSLLCIFIGVLGVFFVVAKERMLSPKKAITVSVSLVVILKVLYSVGFSLSLLATIFFSFVWWERDQMPYNEAGRYYDGLVVWHEQAVGVYALLAVVSLIVSVVMVVLFRKVQDDKGAC